MVILALSGQVNWFKRNQKDHLLIGVHVLGLLITLGWTFFKAVPMATFFNYAHVALILAVLLIVHGLSLSRDELNRLIITLVVTLIGVSLFITLPAYYYGEYGRFSGFYKNPNYAAFAINFTIYYLAVMIGKARRLDKLLLFIILILHQVLALLATGSRAGILAMLILLCIIFLVGFSKWGKLLALISVLTIPLVLDMNPIRDRFLNEENSIGVNRIMKLREEADKEIRWSLWRGGWDAALEHYFIGIGIQQFNEEFDDYMSEYRGWWSKREKGLGLHSLYLTILVEYGFIAFLLLLAYILGYLNLALRNIRRYKEPLDLFRGIVYLQLLLFAVTTTTLRNPTYWFIFALITVIMVDRRNGTPNEKT